LNNYKVTIITVTYNAEKYIENTIKSVINQSYLNKEFIIIDGKSTDSTLNIISKYKQYVNTLISEYDNGIFDAMNKGINLATGDWLIFINAGDLFFNSEVISKIDFEKLSNYGIVYGNTLDIGGLIRKPFNISILKHGIIMACHQSMLFNKNKLNKDLYYSNKYNFYNDFELVARIVKKYNVIYQDINIACYLGGGYSSVTSWQARKCKYIMLFRLYGMIGILNGLLYKFFKVGHE
jgi:glycosyltransferase involved in cell wall biosynthesis